MAQPSNQTAAFATYNSAEQLTFAQAVAFALLYFQPWMGVPMTDVQWYSLIEALFPYVKVFRDNSSRSARFYYDTERALHLAKETLDLDNLANGTSGRTIERFPIFLANYRSDWLRQSLEPVRERFQEEVTSDGALKEAAGIIGKQALNGGRRTLLRAVEKDPVVEGWARVQGGNESCAFCWMLISRGPVYTDADNAGINADDETAVEIFRQWQDTNDSSALDALMTRWHDNCDCRVVPVFDKSADWPGKDDWRDAEDFWIKTTKGYKGVDKYRAFRRALADGIAGSGNPDLPVPQAA